MNIKLILSPAWSLRQNGNTLFIHGGADAVFSVDLESPEASFWASLKPGKPFTRAKLSTTDQLVLEQLLSARVIVPVLPKTTPISLAILGDFELGSTLPAPMKLVKDPSKADLLLLVRTNQTYADLLAEVDYASITKPHLFVDLAYNHTVSLGPLVFVGETACVACLQGRIGTRWGDEQPPTAPAAVLLNDIVRPLIALELSKIITNDTSLANQTVAWNFQDRTVSNNSLQKVALCPICSNNKLDDSGRMALPWE